jgi:hypothetical protein
VSLPDLSIPFTPISLFSGVSYTRLRNSLFVSFRLGLGFALHNGNRIRFVFFCDFDWDADFLTLALEYWDFLDKILIFINLAIIWIFLR